MKKLYDRACFMNINPKTISTAERRQELESLIFQTEKKNGLIKADTLPMAIHKIGGWTESRSVVQQL